MSYPIIPRGVFENNQSMELDRLLQQLKVYIDSAVNPQAIAKSLVSSRESANLLFNGLVAPLIGRDESGNPSLQSTNTLNITVADVPDLPASKTTSGRFPETRLPVQTCRSDFIISLGIPAPSGTIVMEDDDGHTVNVVVA